MNLNEEVSGTNHDEVSRLQTQPPRCAVPLPNSQQKGIFPVVFLDTFCRRDLETDADNKNTT